MDVIKTLLRTLSAFCILSTACCSNPDPKDNRATQPNVIYILADDLGYGDLSCYNPDSKIATPNLDRLAAAGMRFTDMHSPSSVCTPTRYGIMTGQYCWRSELPRGVLRGYGRKFIADSIVSVPQLLSDKGYTTGVIGKWHLGLNWSLRVSRDSMIRHAGTQTNDRGIVTEMDPELINFNDAVKWGPNDMGFDYSYILPASLDMDPYCYLENGQLIEAPTAHTPGNDLNTGYTGAFWRAGRMAPTFEFYDVLPTFRRQASQFIEQHAASESPFFLYLPLAAPHTPWVPTGEYSMQSGAGQYGDFVQMVDSEVGLIMDQLESLDLASNTLVIFTSDNGPFWTPALIDTFNHRAAGHLRGMKADAFEGGHRIPYIARWPGQIPSGSQSQRLASLTHLRATLLDILDYKSGVPMYDSKSILEDLLGMPSPNKDDYVIHHSSRAYFAIRQGDWKYIEGLGSGGFSKPSRIEPIDSISGQLYNLQADPLEAQNLFLEEVEKREHLAALLKEARGF